MLGFYYHLYCVFPFQRLNSFTQERRVVRKTPLKPISNKRQVQLREYYTLVTKLRELCHNKSELNGHRPDWQSLYLVDPHHIGGRNGERLLDPFGIILLTRTEHDIQEGKINGVKLSEEDLYNIVYPLRIAQGFKPKVIKGEEK